MKYYRWNAAKGSYDSFVMNEKWDEWKHATSLSKKSNRYKRYKRAKNERERLV